MDDQDVTHDFSDLKLEILETTNIVEEVKDEPEADKGIFGSLLFWKRGGRKEIHLAAQQGRLDRVKEIVEKGENINIKDDEEWTPLDYASSMGHVEVVEFLESKNAIINSAF